MSGKGNIRLCPRRMAEVAAKEVRGGSCYLESVGCFALWAIPSGGRTELPECPRPTSHPSQDQLGIRVINSSTRRNLLFQSIETRKCVCRRGATWSACTNQPRARHGALWAVDRSTGPKPACVVSLLCTTRGSTPPNYKQVLCVSL